ncbi:hypothetical protein BGX38DRAFT_1141130 [Terfezia claveryi]|nr:hypothetical protein BGX38DRAFT_1141130 [Terfezia claveryi]
MHSRDHAFRMLELNLCSWDKDVSFDSEVKALIMTMRKDAEGMGRNYNHPRLTSQPLARNAIAEPLSVLAQILQIPNLIGKFQDYLRANGYWGVATADMEGIETYRGQYLTSIAVAVQQFQGDGLETHHVRWTGNRDFRRHGNIRADWIWVRMRPRSQESSGQLDGHTVARLEGIFRIWNVVGRTYEVAYMRFLRVKGSSRPHSEEGIIRMEKREDEGAIHVIKISDIEGMAHLIPVEAERVWLVNNRIDFNTWNELYD